MNKKFLSAILCGAMLVTAIGTFVSCKDYDDDIEDLQSQIDGLTTSSSSLSSSLSSVQSSLESQLSSTQSTLQSQITSAQSALQSAIDEKADAEVISTLAGNVATLTENYEATVATLNAQITAAQTAITSLESADSDASTAIANANAVLAALTGTTPSDDAATVEAVAANMKIQLDAVVAFQAAVEAADYQQQIDDLKQYIGASDNTSAGLTQQLEDVKTQLETAINDITTNTTDIAQLQQDVQTINDALIDINPNLDALTLLVKNGVTSIDLVYSNYKQQTYVGEELDITVATQQANIFEDNNLDNFTIAHPIEFKAGYLYQVPAEFVVRVSPVNAELTPDMIQFVNSQGETLDGIVEVKSVEKYNTLLTKATAATGLWTVSVQLVDQTTKSQMEAKTKKSNKDILFAIQVNNSTSSDSDSNNYADRYVTSSYDLTMVWTDYTPATSLYYFVGDDNVSALVNRYANGGSNPSLPNTPSLTPGYTELTWAVDANGNPVTAVEPITSGSNKNVVTADSNSSDPDDRSTSAYKLYPAVQGEAFTIALTESGSDTEVKAPSKIRAMYVTLDMSANAIESAPSEWNAWNSYSYTGLNDVVEGTKTSITINKANGVINDIIGFRVYAVNYDGTLVDPDGKAFYVAVGDVATNWNATATTIVPEHATTLSTPSDTLAVSLTALTGLDHAIWETDNVSGTNAFTAHFYNASNESEVFNTDQVVANSSALNSLTLTNVTGVYTTINQSLTWSSFKDGKAYTGTLTCYDEYEHVLASIKVTMTKNLPTGMPAGFSAKTNQIVNGVYYCYLVPDQWTVNASGTTANQGTMPMSHVFNFGTEYDGYTFEFAKSVSSTSSSAVTLSGESSTLEITDFDLIDNSTKHATTVTYDYGDISSESNNKPTYKQNYTFNIIYECVYNDTYSWKWVDLAEWNAAKSTSLTTLPYSTDLTYGTDVTDQFDDYILGTSLWDGLYSGFLSNPYGGSLYITDATLNSNANSSVDNEYFEPQVSGGHITGFTATLVTSDTNPTGAIPSTLTIKATDMYNHELEIKLAMNVVRR